MNWIVKKIIKRKSKLYEKKMNEREREKPISRALRWDIEQRKKEEKLNSNEEGGERELTSTLTTMPASSKMNFSTTKLSDFYFFLSFCSFFSFFNNKLKTKKFMLVAYAFFFLLFFSFFFFCAFASGTENWQKLKGRETHWGERQRKKIEKRSIAFPSFLFFWMQWMIITSRQRRVVWIRKLELVC